MANVSSNNLTTLYSGGGVNIRPTSAYGNSNVASFLNAGTDGANTITNIVATGNITANNVNANTVYSQGMAVQGYDFVQMQYSNAVALPVSPYDIGTGSWFYLDPGGAVWQSNTTGTINTVTLGNDGNVTANYFIGNIVGNITGTANFANYAGNVTISAQPNITSVGTLVNVNATGNITSVSGVFVGNGSGLTNLTGANVTGTVANANYAAYAGNVTNSAQPNITSVGTLTGLISNGIVNFANAANVNLGSNSNIHISGGAANYALITDGSGNLSWGQVANAIVANYANYAGNLINGTSNVNTNGANGNITVSINGVANVLTATSNTIIVSNLNILSNTIALGNNAGLTNQGANSVAIGANAGSNIQGNNAVAIGANAGYGIQGNNSIALGQDAGRFSNDYAIAIGYGAGSPGGPGFLQGSNSIAIGSYAGQYTQNINSIAIGHEAGLRQYNSNSIAIGQYTQRLNSLSGGTDSIAIGSNAGFDNQGSYAIAIGSFAGSTNQVNNSIILNATGANLDQTTANTFTVKPVRNANTANVMFYNNTTGEITYDLASNATVANANFASYAGQANTANLATFATTANAVAGANVSGIVANANYASYAGQANTANLATFATTANSVAGANVSGVVANANYASYAGNATSVTPAGSNTQIQFNVGNTSLGASANLTFDTSTNLLTTSNAKSGYLSIINSGNTAQTTLTIDPSAPNVGVGAGSNSYFIQTSYGSNNTPARSEAMAVIKARGNSASPQNAANGDVSINMVGYIYTPNGIVRTGSIAIASPFAANTSFTGPNTYWTPGSFNLVSGSQNGNVLNANSFTNQNLMAFTFQGNELVIPGTYGANTGIIQVWNYGSNADSTFGPGSQLILSRARGNRDSNVAITTGDTLGTLTFQGYTGGGGFQRGAGIIANANGTITSGATFATDMTLFTSNSGYINIGNTSTTGNFVVNYTSTFANNITVNANANVTGNISGANVSINTNGFMKLASYTASALTAITGSVGWMAAVTDSTPGGRIAYWDTTNARWSYVSDNSAV